MEGAWDKMGALIGALVTALGGFYMYDRKVAHERLTKVEETLSQTVTDVRVIEAKFAELKADTEEIKNSQHEIITLLTKRKR